MKHLVSLLGILVMSYPSNANTFDPHAYAVQKMILDLQENPRGMAKDVANRFVGYGKAPMWEKTLSSDLAMLDVVAYYAELQAAIEDKSEHPKHRSSGVYDRFFYGVLLPQQFAHSARDFASKAHEFAVALMRELNDRETEAEYSVLPGPRTARLVATLLKGGREFWIRHAMREVIERRMPISEDLELYARALPDGAYERFLSALMKHHPEFRGSQNVIQALVSHRTENLLDVPMTGDATCDAMLQTAIHGTNFF